MESPEKPKKVGVLVLLLAWSFVALVAFYFIQLFLEGMGS